MWCPIRCFFWTDAATGPGPTRWPGPEEPHNHHTKPLGDMTPSAAWSRTVSAIRAKSSVSKGDVVLAAWIVNQAAGYRVLDSE